ncbi:MAG: hypothetical protein KGI54_09705 [Pseudomonadota bacterium]|nr:hypothetical protein [Pseudomonadota bacterium]
MEPEDWIITIAESDGLERVVESLDEARRFVWFRMKNLFGSDQDVARILLMALTEKSSFHDLDAADCFDLSYLFLDENVQLLRDELEGLGLGALISRINLA